MARIAGVNIPTNKRVHIALLQRGELFKRCAQIAGGVAPDQHHVGAHPVEAARGRTQREQREQQCR